MKTAYKTIAQEAQAELVEKRSRFIATAAPVQTEQEALDLLARLRQKYWDARHNVYAYILQENNVARYSDDGEPSGTAGPPVLDMLKKEGLSNLIVVVTRYFGGILLGTGGLVHAYSKSSKMGVEAAGIVRMVLCRELFINCDYTWLGKIQNHLASWPDMKGLAPRYAEKVVLPIYLPVDQTDQFITSLIDVTNSRASITMGDTCFHSFPEQ